MSSTRMKRTLTGSNDRYRYGAYLPIYTRIPYQANRNSLSCKSGIKIWVPIKSPHVGAERVREPKFQTLDSEFERMKMKDTETVDEFAGKLSSLASKGAALGQTIEEQKLFEKIINNVQVLSICKWWSCWNKI